MTDSLSSALRVTGARLYFLPVHTRVPYQFGSETMTEVVCARVRLSVQNERGRIAEGWGETPLSVQWVWQGTLPYGERLAALQDFCARLTTAWAAFEVAGHPLEIGHAFLQHALPALRDNFNWDREALRHLPWLAALACCSPFDLALYDAYGNLTGHPVYETLGPDHLRFDLAAYLEPAEGSKASFAGKYPADFLSPRQNSLPTWHSVGGADPIFAHELTGHEPRDGYPILLEDWIARDGLRCLKVKLRGNDLKWDFRRLVDIGEIGTKGGVDWLCADFNCTATDPAYVIEVLDRLMHDAPRIYGMLLYVEQPFPYDLEAHPFDVHAIAARKPLFMDESAHDWRLIRYGRSLGWTSVALKTCKTQTVALLSLCWAKAHGMTLMVQDLTNPMLAMIPHALLAAHAGTIMGLECNAMQFYPEASRFEASVHPALYTRRNGRIDLGTLTEPGYGYQLGRITRPLPAVAAEA